MEKFRIYKNDYLSKDTNAFFHTFYLGFERPGNPDYLNILKNTYNDYPQGKLQTAVSQLRSVLDTDLPQIFQALGFNILTVCVVPRAKAESTYHKNQQLFRATVQKSVGLIDGLVDGTGYIRRHTNTRTTHLSREIPNYNNDGKDPYPGITKDTCYISPSVRGIDILLVDDIYTPGVNVDEDAINALLDAGARSVTFYAVAYTKNKFSR